ncbi:hypothetical protein [Kiloniella majae]|uniref:hypothetical protein n=1 Tax=Kiloniella majae TaxID=1938558 RepID=UPI000A2778C1|nr:hypothetical protein [Kiloniella majae]
MIHFTLGVLLKLADKIIFVLSDWHSLEDKLPEIDQEVWIETHFGTVGRCVFVPDPIAWKHNDEVVTTYSFIPVDEYALWTRAEPTHNGIPAKQAYVKRWRAAQ